MPMLHLRRALLAAVTVGGLLVSPAAWAQVPKGLLVFRRLHPFAQTASTA
jgi:hypothetical protein